MRHSDSLVRSTSRRSRKTPPFVGPGLARDDVHQRRLARAVGSDQTAQLALFQLQRDVGQRLEALEADRQLLDPQHQGAMRGLGYGHRDDGRRVFRCRVVSRRAHSQRLPRPSPENGGEGEPQLGNEADQAPRQKQRHDDEQRHPARTARPTESCSSASSCRRRRSTAPITAPTSDPRPPTATQIAISIEFEGCISLGLMIPTCGT